MSWTAIVVLAAGAYLFKAVGLLVLGPLTARAGSADPTGPSESTDEDHGGPVAADGGGTDRSRPEPAGGWPLQLGQLLPPALLAALVVSQTVTSGRDLVVDARLAGVLAGAVAVWRGAPFWLVLAVAATVTAALRLTTG
jgi:hypothetical protein